MMPTESEAWNQLHGAEKLEKVFLYLSVYLDFRSAPEERAIPGEERRGDRLERFKLFALMREVDSYVIEQLKRHEIEIHSLMRRMKFLERQREYNNIDKKFELLAQKGGTLQNIKEIQDLLSTFQKNMNFRMANKPIPIPLIQNAFKSYFKDVRVELESFKVELLEHEQEKEKMESKYRDEEEQGSKPGRVQPSVASVVTAAVNHLHSAPGAASVPLGKHAVQEDPSTLQERIKKLELDNEKLQNTVRRMQQQIDDQIENDRIVRAKTEALFARVSEELKNQARVQARMTSLLPKRKQADKSGMATKHPKPK